MCNFSHVNVKITMWINKNPIKFTVVVRSLTPYKWKENIVCLRPNPLRFKKSIKNNIINWYLSDWLIAFIVIPFKCEMSMLRATHYRRCNWSCWIEDDIDIPPFLEALCCVLFCLFMSLRYSNQVSSQHRMKEYRVQSYFTEIINRLPLRWLCLWR